MRPPLPEHFWLLCILGGIAGGVLTAIVISFFADAEIPRPTFDDLVRDAWSDLVEKDDRTSPEEYPDMALVTVEELREFMDRVRQALA